MYSPHPSPTLVNRLPLLAMVVSGLLLDCAWCADPPKSASAVTKPVPPESRPGEPKTTSEDPQAKGDASAAQPVPAEALRAAWNLESIELADGRVYSGLILADEEAEIEFAEIIRPPGKPMFAVIRPIDPDVVVAKHSLGDDERQILLERFSRFRSHTRIEAGRMEDIVLREHVRDGRPAWLYTGSWFSLESSTDETMTRRCAVRVEQIFRAYRQLFPPRIQGHAKLRLLILGSLEEYQSYLDQAGFEIASPAFYSVRDNLVVAGSDMNGFSQRLRQVRQRSGQSGDQLAMLEKTFAARLAIVLDELRRRGYSAGEIDQEARIRRLAWQREYEAAITDLARIEAQNELLFNAVTDQMFARLYHEAFHAYLENYVYPAETTVVPRWLNEGLAQIFETGQLEADTLRIDAPDALRLSALQEAFGRDDAFRLESVLQSDESEFMAAHHGRTAEQRYLYAWGLAYYLAFERNVLTCGALDEYVRNPESLGPTAGFTGLIGMPLSRFAVVWRDFILAIPPPSARARYGTRVSPH